ncbi:rRNA maturation RNase YbeY [Granulicella sp. dw_53]|uniref:rRNA maturation RNase YbeY n=1 Tax=Granulicella sp. dw_53 TaxID=2719792 RepID=UPI001BD341DB|nr:rRNA maturation RNase YbeY [Granulicella sp. dw_53]
MITIEPPSTPPIPALSKPSLTRFLNRARTAVGLSGEVDVLLTSDVQLKSLNRSFRGKNKATDVLSFPTPPEIAAQHAGDLAISLDTATRQAATYGHPLDVEVKILLLHGLLHLAGEDHETDTGQMAARESSLRAKLKLPGSLIDRVTNPLKPQLKPRTRPIRKASR